MSNFQLVQVLTGHEKSISCVKYSYDGLQLASASADGQIKLWDTCTGKLLSILRGHGAGISEISWSGDGKILLSASDDCTLKFWGTHTGRTVKSLVGHSDKVFSCSLNQFTDRVASGSCDKTVKIWHIGEARAEQTYRDFENHVTCVDMPRIASTEVLAGSLDGQALRIDRSTSRILWEYENTHEPVTFARYSATGQFFLLSTMNGTIRMFKNSVQENLKTFRGHENNRYCMFASVTSGSKYLVSGSENGRVFVWDIYSQKIVQIMDAHSGPVVATDCNPKFEAFASACLGDYSVIKIWRNKSKKTVELPQARS